MNLSSINFQQPISRSTCSVRPGVQSGETVISDLSSVRTLPASQALTKGGLFSSIPGTSGLTDEQLATIRTMAANQSSTPRPKKKLNLIQKTLIGVGDLGGQGLRGLSHGAGWTASAAVKNNPFALVSRSASGVSSVLGAPKGVTNFLGGVDRASQTGGNVVKSGFRGVGEFGAGTLEGVTEMAAHPVQTVRGVGVLATSGADMVPYLGRATTGFESFVCGEKFEDVRAEKKQNRQAIVDGYVESFVEKKDRIGTTGAVVSSILDVGVPGKLGLSALRKARGLGGISKPSTGLELKEARDVIEGLKGDEFFHATTSDAWAGLAETGKLMPPTELKKAGVVRESGEGTLYNARGANRDFVSFAAGRDGLGSVMRYHDNLAKAPFSFGGLSKRELGKELADARKVIEHPKFEKLTEIYPSGAAYVDRLADLKREATRRIEDPGRKAPFPMILQMKGEGLDARPSSDVIGEMRVRESLSLADRLERVVVPEKNLAEMARRLDSLLGPDHGVKLMKSEALHEARSSFPEMFYSYRRQSAGGPNDGIIDGFRDVLARGRRPDEKKWGPAVNGLWETAKGLDDK